MVIYQMNKRQSKKIERGSVKHGYYTWVKEISRKANVLDEHCYLRNNWRKWHKCVMFRKVNNTE